MGQSSSQLGLQSVGAESRSTLTPCPLSQNVVRFQARLGPQGPAVARLRTVVVQARRPRLGREGAHAAGAHGQLGRPAPESGPRAPAATTSARGRDAEPGCEPADQQWAQVRFFTSMQQVWFLMRMFWIRFGRASSVSTPSPPLAAARFRPAPSTASHPAPPPPAPRGTPAPPYAYAQANDIPEPASGVRRKPFSQYGQEDKDDFFASLDQVRRPFEQRPQGRS